MPDEAPLAGRRVVVTREQSQGESLMAKLRARGATPISAPAIRILPPDPDTELREAVARIADYDWVVLTSPNGAKRLADGLFVVAPPRPWTFRVACVGAGTAAALREACNLDTHFEPSVALGDALARELPVSVGRRVLWPRSEIANLDFAQTLRERGAVVDAPVAYRTVANVDLLAVADAMRDARVDALTFTSPSTVRHFVDGLASAGLALTELAERLRPAVVCIGPVTAAAAGEAGLSVDAVAEPSDEDGLVDAVVRILSRRESAA